jgi:L-alanine-DL-glutamate epimerase-like enolase superfamily enzyme
VTSDHGFTPHRKIQEISIMQTRRLQIALEAWPLDRPFRITGHVFTATPVIVVEVSDGTHTGRGEAAGVYYRNDRPDEAAAVLESLRAAVEVGLDRAALGMLLPPGGARNALDCALWDLEARQTGRAVWSLAGLEPPRPLLTTFTVGADDPEVMASVAKSYAGTRAIKLKLTGDGRDAARVAAVRADCPDVWLAVDANQGFTPDSLQAALPAFVEHRVMLVEQPFPVGRDAWLDGMARPIPVAADESAQSLEDLDGLCGRFDVVNIKLDKCGGLSEGLAMARRAQALGLGVMVGNMMGTSLAMAPAFVLGQLCDVVDLDGPVFLRRDRAPAVVYRDGMISIDEAFWGGVRS